MVVIRIDTINSFDPVWACTAFPTLATTHKAPIGFLLVCLLLLHREEGTPKMKTDPQSKCSNCFASHSYVLQGRRKYFISWGTYFLCDKCHRLAIMGKLRIGSEPPSEPPKWCSDTSPQPNHPYIALQKPPLAAPSRWGLFLGIGFASKHGEFKLLGESRLFHNGTSMYAV